MASDGTVAKKPARCIDCERPITVPSRQPDRHDFWQHCIDALKHQITTLEGQLADRDAVGGGKGWGV